MYTRRDFEKLYLLFKILIYFNIPLNDIILEI